MPIDFNLWGHTDDHKELDFAQIKAISTHSIQAILEYWQPGGKVVRGEYLCGSKEGGKGESCSTNVSSGVGSDFATGEKWGDAIDLVAKIEGVSMSEAARKLQDFLSIGPGDPRPIPSIPQQSPAERYEAGRKIAFGLWVESEACPHTHPYLIKKQVNADQGIRLHPPTGNILVPLYDEHGAMWSVQRIAPDGDKKISANGKLTGNFYLIAGERDTVYVCEGYATAQTVAMATGKMVVVAVSTGNLAAVGEKISRMFPTSHLVFAADNDQGGDINPGVKAANEAVKHVGRGSVVAPPFPEGQKGDWNDYAVLHGGAAVRKLLMKDIKQLFVDVHDLHSIETDFLIDGVMEMPCTSMVFGASGSGKSFFVIDLALHIASGRRWLDKETKTGPVFYICGEGRHGIPRRVRAWEKHCDCQVPKGRFMVSNLRLNLDQESTADMVACIDHLAESIGTPAMIIIDTMARTLPGNADENSAKDTNLFFNECDRLQSHYNCAVLVVHHSGHSDAKRARGSSAIKGVLDVEIMLNNGIIEWTKTKDMEPPAPIRYELQKIVFGEGKRDNSCIISYDTSRKVEKRETAHRTAAKSSLVESIQAEGIGSDRCTVQGWKERFALKFETLSDRAQRKYFKTQLNAMVDEGLIVIDGVVVMVTSESLREHVSNMLMFGNKMTIGTNGTE